MLDVFSRCTLAAPGLASGRRPDGTYERLWFEELVAPDEVTFDAGVFLLWKDSAKALKSGARPEPGAEPSSRPGPEPITPPEPSPVPRSEPVSGASTKTLRLVGTVPPEIWNRLGTKILPKLRSHSDLRIALEFTVTVKADTAGSLTAELPQRFCKTWELVKQCASKKASNR